MNNQQFEFLPLKESDLPTLTEWLNRPHLQKWWKVGEITENEARKEYLSEKEDSAKSFIAYLDGIPTGYIQCYSASKDSSNWWPDKPGPGVWGIDLFLANQQQLNRGIGARFVFQFVNFLFQDPNVREIRIDPHPENLRAIRCFEKVGFKKVDRITTPDGPAVMMALDKKSFEKH